MQIEKVYEPQRFEPHWAEWWIRSGIFHAAGTVGRTHSSAHDPLVALLAVVNGPR